MRSNIRGPINGARIVVPGSGSETPDIGTKNGITPTSGTDENDWFYNVAQGVLGKDAGLHLHLITGYPRTSCYAYVAHNAEQRRRPPDHFLRKLFHSEQGEPFRDAFMRGCEAKWWVEEQRYTNFGREMAAAAGAFVRGMESR
jgi:hypothetical protein